jgi:hypothetical protein
MTFANVGSLGTIPGQRDAVVSILLRPMAGLWESPEAHRASLQLDSVRAAIAEAMPLLSGDMGGHQFNVLGSPLR